MIDVTVIMHTDGPSRRTVCPRCGRRRIVATWKAWYTVVVGPPFWMGTCKRPIGEMCQGCAMDRRERLEEEMES